MRDILKKLQKEEENQSLKINYFMLAAKNQQRITMRSDSWNHATSLEGYVRKKKKIDDNFKDKLRNNKMA